MKDKTQKKNPSRLLWVITAVVLIAAAALAIFLPKMLEADTKPVSASDVAVTDENQICYTVEVYAEGEEVCKTDIAIVEGVNLIDAMAAAITEDGGVVYSDGAYGAYITSICGHSEDAEKSMYWTFTINDQYVNEGASSCYPKEGDKVVFSLDVLTW